MPQNDRYRDYWRNLAGAPGPDDGVDPRRPSGRSGRRRADRKTLQLCGQVADTLNFVLSGECDDDVLRNVYVVRVEPAPDASQLMVVLAPFDPNDAPPADVIHTHLGHASSMLRREVAESISRRKAPQLLFRVLNPDDIVRESQPDVPPGEGGE